MIPNMEKQNIFQTTNQLIFTKILHFKKQRTWKNHRLPLCYSRSAGVQWTGAANPTLRARGAHHFSTQCHPAISPGNEGISNFSPLNRWVSYEIYEFPCDFWRLCCSFWGNPSLSNVAKSPIKPILPVKHRGWGPWCPCSWLERLESSFLDWDSLHNKALFSWIEDHETAN